MSEKIDSRKGVELGDTTATLGQQRIRLVEDLRNPPLLGKGQNGNPEFLEFAKVDTGLRRLVGRAEQLCLNSQLWETW